MEYTFRPGIRTTQTVNPQDLKQVVDGVVSNIAPRKTQLYSLLDMGLKRAAPPPNTRKVQTISFNQYDSLDFVDAVTLGLAGNNETRFARLAVQQRGALQTASMFYQPGERLALDNGQSVEVVMTPNAILPELTSLTTALTGNTTTRSAAGTIVVRNVEPTAIRTGINTFYQTGFPVYEGAPVQAQGIQGDVVYDLNYIEEIEGTFGFTEQELEYVSKNLHGIKNDRDWTQKINVERMKQHVENQITFGVRQVDYTYQPNLPKYHMGGLFYYLRDNVMLYNPDTTTNYEDLIESWMEEHVFDQDSQTTKVVGVGRKLWRQFQKEFRNFRRIDMGKGNAGLKPGALTFDTYDFAGQTIKLMPFNLFRAGTRYENWAFAIDPAAIELIEKKKFTVEPIPKDKRTMRIEEFLIQWAGTIRVNNPRTHALLRTA